MGPAVLEKKGKTSLVLLKTEFWEKRKTKQNFRFSFWIFFLLIRNIYRLSFHGTKIQKKRKCFFFRVLDFRNLGFLGTRRVSILFIFTTRVEHTSKHLRKWKSENWKKVFFWLRKGGVPLKRWKKQSKTSSKYSGHSAVPVDNFLRYI